MLKMFSVDTVLIPGESGVELCLAMVNKVLSVWVGLDEDVADGIP